MSVLKIRDENGKFIPIKSIKGESAYEQAKAGGYLGTEEEFIRALASLGGEYALQTINDGYDEHIDDKNNPHKVTAEQVGAIPIHYPTSSDLNTELARGDNTITVCCYYGETLNTPYKEGKTACTHGMVITNAHSTAYATQLCLPSGDDIIFLRQLSGGKVDEWFAVYNANQLENILGQTVKKTGDTMTGAITISKPSNWGQYVIYSPAGHYRCFEADDGRVRIDVRDHQLTTDRRFIDFYSNVGESSVANALKLCQSIGGNSVIHPILHTGNINDFAISKGSYSGDNATSKTIPIRKTTQMVIVYGTSGGGDAYTLGILVRGMAKAHCNIGPTDYTNCLNVEWGDTTVKYSYENAAALYSWNAVGATYNYVLVG